MKVRFNVNSGANVYSTNTSDWYDTVKDLGYEEGEWEGLSEEDKYKEAKEWASNYLEIYYEENHD